MLHLLSTVSIIKVFMSVGSGRRDALELSDSTLLFGRLFGCAY